MIFSHRGLTASNVPLRLVERKHLADLSGQRRVYGGQTLRSVFMNARLAYAEFGGGLTNRTAGLHQISANAAAALFDVLLQIFPSPYAICT